MSEIQVVGLNYYPIKSCAAVTAEEVTLSELGIEYDREWMLVSDDGQHRFLSQRSHPTLALVQAEIKGGVLVANAPGMGTLTVPLEEDPDAAVVPITLWKKPGSGTDQGREANGYFSEYLDTPTRLLRVADPRSIKPECRVPGASERTGFADGFPMLLGSMASLAALNGHIAVSVTMDRFRPNIVVDGDQPYDEDYWREVRIGDLTAFVVRTCARCPVPNIDQRIGVLPREADRVVSQALRATRQGFDVVDGGKGVHFGQNLTHVFEPGVVVRVGDAVTVVQRANERNVELVG